MGGFDFEWNGKTYSVMTEGGYPFFDNDEVEEAFEQWRVTKEGVDFFGPVPTDWSKEHYLDERYPFDHEKGCRVDAESYGNSNNGGDGEEDEEEEDFFEEPYIDWTSYEKCRYGCYQHFYLTSDTHECSYCGVYSCKECARGSFKRCSSKDCDEWICGKHGSKKKCSGCSGK